MHRPSHQVIPEGPDGRICQVSLVQELQAHQAHPLLIGSFSAGSNVTGECPGGWQGGDCLRGAAAQNLA